MAEDQIGALLEDINGKFQTIIEGQEAFTAEIASLRSDMNERFEELDTRFRVIHDYINAVDKQVHKHDSLIKQLQTQ